VHTHFNPLYPALSTKGKLYERDLDKSTLCEDTNNEEGVVQRNHTLTSEHQQRFKITNRYLLDAKRGKEDTTHVVAKTKKTTPRYSRLKRNQIS
jgi:hypothetical protein